MRVIVCGAGQVGYNIARQLADERNDVHVIDQQPHLVRRVSDTLDARASLGHAAHPDVLEEAGAREADMLIAVTQADEINMVACQVAHSIFKVPKKVARIRAQTYLTPTWRDMFSRDHMPIDVIISPEIEVARTVLRRLGTPGALESAPFVEDRVRVVGVSVDGECPIVNTPLRQLTELFPDLDSVIVGISRDGRMIAPSADDQLLAGDDAFFVARTSHVPRALGIFGHEEPEARRVIIAGGGNIGLDVARRLEREQHHVRAKLIEYDRARAEWAAERLQRTVVLHGDALDQEILAEANVAETEAIVALTDNDQVNILASVIAKRAGCRRGLCLINREDYRGLVYSLGIDAFIDPRATTVSTIMQHVRRGRIKALRTIRGGEAEAIEAEALETSPLVGKPLRDIKLASGVLIGAVVRKDQVFMPRGDTVIAPGDRVVLFALRDAVPKVEQLFRVSLEYF